MAVTENRLNSALVLKYQVGTKPDGSPDIRQKTLSNIKPDADHGALYEVAVALFSLSAHGLTGVLVRDMTELIEE